MKNMPIKIVLSTIFLFFINNNLYSNAAQPGIWNAGGTVFTMLYPEDSLSFKKVQMKQEQIFIQLYKGYAVVKGVYVFKNTTNETLQFKMGYPVNGIYAGGENDLNEVTLDSLSHFKIKTKNNWVALINESHPELKNSSNTTQAFSDNWKVWQMEFKPNETQMVEVYFIVNTNNAQIRKGYNIDYKNAFIYLLESGSVWHLPIEKGQFYIQLKDGLQTDDINGLSSGFNFKYNNKHKIYIGEKHNFSPTAKDNLVVTYYKKDESFSLTNVVSRFRNLYETVDDFSLLPKDKIDMKSIVIGNPYKVKTTSGGYLPMLLMLVVMYGPIILGIVILILFIKFFFKKMKIK